MEECRIPMVHQNSEAGNATQGDWHPKRDQKKVAVNFCSVFLVSMVVV